jgi:hypothetical protein
MKTNKGGISLTIKKLVPLALSALFIVSACSDFTNDATDKDRALDPVRNQESPPVDNDLNDKLGYVHYTRSELDTDNAPRSPILTLDRNAVANMITKTIMQNEGFEEVATLVTDEEVLIAYKKTDDMDQNRAADIAKSSAMSVTPRYFDIYVSDDDLLIKDIHSLHRSSTKNKNYDNTIDQIINEMKKAPQGD